MQRTAILRILFVEDMATDVELAIREIKKAGIAFEHMRVETKEAFLAELRDFKPHLIISDYAMPVFDGMQALRLSQMDDPARPFIILTGSMNEATAVTCMKAGATDYLIKGRISRLPFAVNEALASARIRKKQETASKALEESRQKYKDLFDNAVVGIYRAKIDWTLLEANGALLHLLGIDREEITSHGGAIRWVNPHDEKNMTLLLRKEGSLNNVEADLFGKEGAIRHCLISAKLYPEEEVVEGTVVDITERKRAEEALKESERRFRALAEHSMDTIIRFDRSHRHLYVNPRIESETGIAPERCIGKTHKELGFPEDLCRLWEEAISSVFETNRVKRLEFQLPSGIWIDWLLAPETDEEGNVVAVIGSARDISQQKLAMEEKRKLEAQLIQAQKIEAIGKLAGGIAHDFNNLLTPILGFTEMILMNLHADDPRRQNFIQVIKAAESASDLTRQLLAFSRKQVLEVKPVDMTQILTGFKKIIRRTIREDIEIRIVQQSEPLFVWADLSQIEQIIMNLAVNAQDAMPEGGVLSFKTERMVLDDALLVNHPEAKPGHYVMLEVADTGKGMEESVLEHIFEPFFTTKEEGKGTGLGLSTVYGCVQQHSGLIDVFSERDKGSRFRIYLPMIESAGEFVEDRSFFETEREADIGNQTVVVVEDNDMVRNLACAILKEQGFRVISAPNGRTCLTLLAQISDPIDVLLTDVIMPDMNGKELHEKISVSRPSLPVIYMSGYSDDVIAHHGVLQKGLHLIHKPFTHKILLKKIREVLAPQA